jgi:hypothetical protein
MYKQARRIAGNAGSLPGAATSCHRPSASARRLGSACTLLALAGMSQAALADVYGLVSDSARALSGVGYCASDSDQVYTLTFDPPFKDSSGNQKAPILLVAPNRDGDNQGLAAGIANLSAKGAEIRIRKKDGSKVSSQFFFMALSPDGYLGAGEGIAQGCFDEDGKALQGTKLINAKAQRTGKGTYKITYDSALEVAQPVVIATGVPADPGNLRVVTVDDSYNGGFKLHATNKNGDNQDTGACFLAVDPDAPGIAVPPGSTEAAPIVNVYGIVGKDGDSLYAGPTVVTKDHAIKVSMGSGGMTEKDGIYNVNYKSLKYQGSYLPVVLVTPEANAEQTRMYNLSSATQAMFTAIFRNSQGDKKDVRFSYLVLDPKMVTPSGTPGEGCQ